MNINEIKTLLEKYRDDIFSCETKFDRIEYIIRLFKQTYPDVPLAIVEYGPISKLVDAKNHIEAQIIIKAMRYMQTAKSEVEVISYDLEDNTNEIISYIQRFIA